MGKLHDGQKRFKRAEERTTMTMRRSARFGAIALGLLCGVLSAQDAPGLRKGNTELGLYLGAGRGLDSTRFSPGGNFSYAISRYVLLFGEYNYLPGLDRMGTGYVVNTLLTPIKTATYPIPFKQGIQDWGGGAHIRLIRTESRMVPYIAIGAGGVRFNESNTFLNFTPPSDFPAISAKKNEPYKFEARTGAQMNYGAGLRYYISQHFGMRFEVKAFRSFNDEVGTPGTLDFKPVRNYVRVAVGLIWQIR